MPSGVQKKDPTDNKQSIMHKGPTQKAVSSAGEKNAWPAGVEDFEEVP
jgi:hypothetical protein